MIYGQPVQGIAGLWIAFVDFGRLREGKISFSNPQNSQTLFASLIFAGKN
jgi:hypothetical protein